MFTAKFIYCIIERIYPFCNWDFKPFPLLFQLFKFILQGFNPSINIFFSILDILSPLKEVRFLDTNVAATPSYDGM